MDKYIKLRIESIKSSQNLVAEKLLQVHNPYPNYKKTDQKIIEDDPSEEMAEKKRQTFYKRRKDACGKI